MSEAKGSDAQSAMSRDDEVRAIAQLRRCVEGLKDDSNSWNISADTSPADAYHDGWRDAINAVLDEIPEEEDASDGSEGK